MVADRGDVDISSIAQQGLQQAEVQLKNAASTLAGAGTSPAFNSDSVDLSAGIIDLMSAKNNFAINISIMKTADQIQKHVIDLLA
jgi:flagellar hook protein FlgE